MIGRAIREVGRCALCLAFLAGLWFFLAATQAIVDGP
jgi:hypothetical protein